MSTQWKFRLGLLLFFGVLSVWNLVWSLGRWDTEEEATRKRAAATQLGTEADIHEAPAWAKIFPTRRIKLGLDLQGGIDLVLQVDIREAVATAVARSANSLEAGMEGQGITDAEVTKTPGLPQLRVSVSTDQVDAVRNYIADRYSIFQVLQVENGDEGSTLQLAFTDSYADTVRKNALDQEMETIRNRIDEFGVTEPLIVPKGDSRINVQLPGIDDPDRAIGLLGKTARLEFHMVDDSVPAATVSAWVSEAAAGLAQGWSDEQMNDLLADKLPPGTRIYWEKEYNTQDRSLERKAVHLLKEEVPLTGDSLENASVQFDNRTNEPYVQMRLDPQGARIFGDLTGENVGKLLAIVLDDNVRSAPVIRDKIPNGVASITLGDGNSQKMFQDSSDLALVLRAGALPAPIYIEENRTVGATLGQDSIERGLQSMLIGLALVLMLMLFYYRIAGIGACVALVVNLVLLLGILASFEATLTLPGIAGIILTIGMAVDANVIINERIREEVVAGKPPFHAVAAGYDNAISTIMDANITTFVTGVVLFQYGTGPVKGFAVTLMAGIITSVYTAVVVTRLIFDWRTEKQQIETLSI